MGFAIQRGCGLRARLRKQSGAVGHVETSGGYLAQNTGTLHIGLGADHRGDVTCTVRWPGGREQVFDGLAPGRVHDLRE